MRKYILSLMAIAVAAPTAAFAGTLPMNTITETERPLVLVGDGAASAYWNDYPGASHDYAYGERDFYRTAPQTGFALQAPSHQSSGGGSFGLFGGYGSPAVHKHPMTPHGGSIGNAYPAAGGRY